jgi:hypothetical protein
MAERREYSPGSEAVPSLTLRAPGNQGDPCIGPLEAGSFATVISVLACTFFGA